jgi:murein DD-endopeptidase MepM/ murein hydrolase activator NlpD
MEYVSLDLDYAAPLQGEITSGFGYRDHPISGENGFHYGIDIAAGEGTPILPSPPHGGLHRREQHLRPLHAAAPRRRGTTSFYAHCSKLLFRKGASVKKGEAIADGGDHRHSTARNLHFEIRKDGVYLNPEYYVN